MWLAAEGMYWLVAPLYSRVRILPGNGKIKFVSPSQPPPTIATWATTTPTTSCHHHGHYCQNPPNIIAEWPCFAPWICHCPASSLFTAPPPPPQRSTAAIHHILFSINRLAKPKCQSSRTEILLFGGGRGFLSREGSHHWGKGEGREEGEGEDERQVCVGERHNSKWFIRGMGQLLSWIYTHQNVQK